MDPLFIRLAGSFDNEELKDCNQGLLNGLTGITLYLYNLARATGNHDYEKRADELIDNVFSDPKLSIPADFENGLAGIGWGIEYLIQNGFSEGDTDEILEEADNKIFRFLNEETINSFDLTNGLTGYIFYLISRLKNKNNCSSDVYLINHELLILCINRLYELVTPHFPAIVKDFYFDLFWRFPVMLYAIAEAFKLNIYNRKIISMIMQWIPNFEAYLPSMNINRVCLATILNKINEVIPDQRIEKQIRLLLYCTDFKALINEFDPEIKSVRFGLPGMMIILDQALKSFDSSYPGHSALTDSFEILRKELRGLYDSLKMDDFKSKQTKHGLSDGIAGLGLLRILFPQIFTSVDF